MKPANWFFLLLSLMLILTALLFGLIPGELSGQGTHSEFSSMRSSGWILTSSLLTNSMAYLLGLIILAVFTVAAFLGIKKASDKTNKQIAPYWLGGFLIYSLMYGITLYSHEAYIHSESPTYFGGFPAPTSWMLYGLGVIPIAFTLLYMVKFNQWVISPEEIERAKSIINSQKES
ncbi:MAG: hypothetical protein AAFR66_21595 [Bacteroidota bacterium]